MGLKLNLIKLAHALGFTRENETVLSEMVKSDVGEVTFMNYTPPTGGLAGDPHLGLVGDAPGEDSVTIKGSDMNFSIARGRLGDCSIGDRVLVRYQSLVQRTRDYVPPDFSRKQVVERADAGVDITYAEVTYSAEQ